MFPRCRRTEAPPDATGSAMDRGDGSSLIPGPRGWSDSPLERRMQRRLMERRGMGCRLNVTVEGSKQSGLGLSGFSGHHAACLHNIHYAKLLVLSSHGAPGCHYQHGPREMHAARSRERRQRSSSWRISVRSFVLRSAVGRRRPLRGSSYCCSWATQRSCLLQGFRLPGIGMRRWLCGELASHHRVEPRLGEQSAHAQEQTGISADHVLRSRVS